MKQFLMRVLCTVCIVGFMVGCEWDAVEEGEAWNDTGYSWVNFNGVYRAVFGGVIVANWTPTPGSDASDVPVNNENIGTGKASQTFYGGILANRPVVAGSLTIMAGGYGFTDNGDGTLTGTLGRTGTIQYSTGAWSIDLQATTISAGASITASYLYTSGGTEGEVEPGNSGMPIYTLTILQQGNLITIIDSNGNTFTGQLGLISRTATTDDNAPEGVVVAQFEVLGQAYGQTIRIVGTLQGSIDRTEENVFFDRQIQGTWIEGGGMTGDILGGAPNISVSLPDSEYDSRPSPSASNTTVYPL